MTNHGIGTLQPGCQVQNESLVHLTSFSNVSGTGQIPCLVARIVVYRFNDLVRSFRMVPLDFSAVERQG